LRAGAVPLPLSEQLCADVYNTLLVPPLQEKRSVGQFPRRGF
jgi:hypothetical protein